ncbi:MAG TPA: type II toxin-antitoxin system VapC family toxin [Caulobacteraceae bacterium]|jgi:ribonuclease VapC|nr:type II toxin-antitoxin system VapC family toxin [Caulobacteraceae bacterium]
MFIDASAICAILLNEADADDLTAKLIAAPSRYTSAIAVFETVRALMRVLGVEPAVARATVARFLNAAEIDFVSIGEAEREAALDAMGRFGKGRHPARLNMGDCFAYACARTRGVVLLVKGDDFSRTDIVPA